MQVTQEHCAGAGACKHTPITRFGHRYQYIPSREVALQALQVLFPSNMRKEKRDLIVRQLVGAK